MTSEDRAAPERSLEGRAAFGGYIGPRRLVDLVRNTAPYLFSEEPPGLADVPAGTRLSELASDPLGWWRIIRRGHLLEPSATPAPEAWTDYFALCVACHFASVATYVPTDVDTKIRDRLWFVERSGEELGLMRSIALALRGWDIRRVTARIVDVEGRGAVSGHDGERLSVLAGALLAHLRAGESEGAQALEEEIDHELRREAAAFDALAAARGRERDLLIVAAALTHNAGDLDQGLSAKGGLRVGEREKERFGRLAHERPQRYGGSFARAAALYRPLLSSEGHRHYPLREVRPLRASPSLLLPVAPFLDDWGRLLARYPEWSPAERAEVVGGIVIGCRKVRGQSGYQRALAGFDRHHPRGLEAPDLAPHYGTAVRRELKSAELRRQIAVRQDSFESSLAKRARAILDGFGQ